MADGVLAVKSAQRRCGGLDLRNVHNYLLPAAGWKQEEILRRLFRSSAGSLATFTEIGFGRPGRSHRSLRALFDVGI